ncbi:MAG: phytanoyl-CoA dioxygenase family protein [Planctomycetes bacterium]|nr:phytanoyl-CoA dioxygenase family protein [Planctomycetota bacterium]
MTEPSFRETVYRDPAVATTLTVASACLHAWRYRKSAPQPAPADETAQRALDELRRDGLTVLPGYLDAESCALLRESIDRTIGEIPDRVWTDEEEADHRLFGFERLDTQALSFFADPWLRGIAQAYTRCELVNLFTLGGRIDTRDGNLGSGGGWHRDSFALQVKAIAYLSDVDEDHGPFQFITGTAQLSNIIRDIWQAGFAFRQTRLDHESVMKIGERYPETFRTLTAPAGTVILADTRGIHRGMPIRSGSRYALTNYYFTRPDVTPSRIAHFESHVPFIDGHGLSPDRGASRLGEDVEAPERETELTV